MVIRTLEQIFEPLKPMTQTILAVLMAVISHLGLITSIVALFVLLFQLKVLYYKSKREKIAYDKECTGVKNGGV